MSSVAVRNNLSTFIDAVLAGNSQALEQATHEVISRTEDTCELLGRIGLLAMRGDSEGHAVLTLGATSMLCRWLIALRHVLGEDTEGQTIGLPLLVQACTAAAPAVRAGLHVEPAYPQALFPSELPADETVSSAMLKAVSSGNVTMVERLLFGLYGTGADYRTLSIRIYDAISQLFQNDGHALLYAVRGAEVLSAIEWGEDAPHYLHWLAPHLVQSGEEPGWVNSVRGFLSEPQHSLTSYRTRLSDPQNKNALPLRTLLLSNASTPQVCQGVYDALIKNGASARGVGSVIALAASDLLQSIGDDDRDLFERAAHSLLFASATRLIYTQVQEVEGLPLLFTAAASLNALYKELSGQAVSSKTARPASSAGGGLIAPALLESLQKQIMAQDVAGALATARRYIQLGHDAQALFSVIGLGAARVDAVADQGHALQIVLAAGDEYLAWPKDLAHINIDGFLQIALRAAALGKRM
jgi:hypothetical protein